MSPPAANTVGLTITLPHNFFQGHCAIFHIASDKNGQCPKISNTKVSDKMIYANSADLDQTAPEGLKKKHITWSYVLARKMCGFMLQNLPRQHWVVDV